MSVSCGFLSSRIKKLCLTAVCSHMSQCLSHVLTRRPRQEASLAPLCSNLRSFGSKSTALKRVLVTLLGHFGPLRSDLTPPYLFGARELCPPLAPSGYDPGPNVRSGVGITSRFYSLKRCFEVKQNEHYFNETKMVIKVRGEIAWLSPVCRILWLTFRSPR